MNKAMIYEFVRIHRQVRKNPDGTKRFTKGDPIGAVVAVKVGEDIRFGWSQCATKHGDRFNKDEALSLAVDRTREIVDIHKIPPRVRKQLEKFAVRAFKYFRPSVGNLKK